MGTTVGDASTRELTIQRHASNHVLLRLDVPNGQEPFCSIDAPTGAQNRMITDRLQSETLQREGHLPVSRPSISLMFFYEWQRKFAPAQKKQA